MTFTLIVLFGIGSFSIRLRKADWMEFNANFDWGIEIEKNSLRELKHLRIAVRWETQ